MNQKGLNGKRSSNMYGQKILCSILIAGVVSTAIVSPTYGEDFLDKAADWAQNQDHPRNPGEYLAKKFREKAGPLIDDLKNRARDLLPGSTNSLKDVEEAGKLKYGYDSKGMDLIRKGMNGDSNFGSELEGLDRDLKSKGFNSVTNLVKRRSPIVNGIVDEYSSAKKGLEEAKKKGAAIIRIGKGAADGARNLFDSHSSAAEDGTVSSGGLGRGPGGSGEDNYYRGQSNTPQEARPGAGQAGNVGSNPSGAPASDNPAENLFGERKSVDSFDEWLKEQDAAADQQMTEPEKDVNDPAETPTEPVDLDSRPDGTSPGTRDEGGIEKPSTSDVEVKKSENLPGGLEQIDPNEKNGGGYVEIEPSEDSGGGYVEIVPDETVSYDKPDAGGFVELRGDPNYADTGNDSMSLDQLDKFFDSGEVKSIKSQLSNYGGDLELEVAGMNSRLRAQWDAIQAAKREGLNRIQGEAAATSQALQSAFAESMRAELGQYTGGAVGSNSRCQLVTVEMNRNSAFLRSNPGGWADNGAGQAYNVRDRNQQLSNWYNQNCR